MLNATRRVELCRGPGVGHFRMCEEVAVVTVHDVAAGLLSRLGSMTTMKLQKLVYYCQAWHLARYGEPLFPDEVQAWREGPVVPRLYAQHRKQYMVVDWQWGTPQQSAAPPPRSSIGSRRGTAASQLNASPG
jgi:hypothetical protein